MTENEIYDPTVADSNAPKKANCLKFTCNQIMNLNPMIHTNIIQSHYWRVNLVEINTYHEIVDEIYYNVKHLEPWEKGSRKTGPGAGGGVRGVGAGGIVSSAFTLMFKLFTMKITRKQLRALLVHKDSPQIRGLGFLLIRYCLSPDELMSWYTDFLFDEEEVTVESNISGKCTIGELCNRLLTDTDWYSTKLPRIPVPIQKKINAELEEYMKEAAYEAEQEVEQEPKRRDEIEKKDYRDRSRSRSRHRSPSQHGSSRRHERPRHDDRDRHRDYDRHRDDHGHSRRHDSRERRHSHHKSSSRRRSGSYRDSERRSHHKKHKKSHKND